MGEISHSINRILALRSNLSAPAIALFALLGSACADAQTNRESGAGEVHPLSGGAMQAITGNEASCQAGGLVKGDTIRVRFPALSQLSGIITDPVLDRTKHPENDSPGSAVTDPNAGDWPTSLDMELESALFEAGTSKQYVAIRFMLAKRNSVGLLNNKVNFLENPSDPNDFVAVLKSTDFGVMICGHSTIYKPDLNDANTPTKVSSWVEIYVLPSPYHTPQYESLNIGLNIGPFGQKGKYLPIYLDPKIKNDGSPDVVLSVEK